MASISASNFTCQDAIDAIDAGMIPCIRVYDSNGDILVISMMSGFSTNPNTGEYVLSFGDQDLQSSSLSTTFQELLDDVFGGGSDGGSTPTPK